MNEKKPRKRGVPSTSKTMKWLKDRGWIATIVEQKVYMPDAPFPVTRDAFNFGDILAAHATRRVTALIQSTSGQGGNLAARARKILDTKEIREYAARWLMAGNRIYCFGWAKRGKPARWTLAIKRIEHFTTPTGVTLVARDLPSRF